MQDGFLSSLGARDVDFRVIYYFCCKCSAWHRFRSVALGTNSGAVLKNNSCFRIRARDTSWAV